MYLVVLPIIVVTPPTLQPLDATINRSASLFSDSDKMWKVATVTKLALISQAVLATE